MSTDLWGLDEVSLDRPSAARMYDYYLGGYHNFEVDRVVARKVIEIYPDAPLGAQANRAFLRRVVRFLVEQGIDQFLDIGSGIPTAGNVHEVAQQINPAARVVYVDIAPVAVAHSEAILKDNSNATVIQADARRPDRILNHPEVKRLLDLSRPLAVLLLVILPFVPDDEEAYGVVRSLRDALAPGSYIAISHSTYENVPREIIEQTTKLYAEAAYPFKPRSRTQMQQFFAGLEWVEPGLVYAPRWWPEGPDDVFLDQPERSMLLAGVGMVTG